MGTKIILIQPSNTSGGLEKVITELSWYLSSKERIRVFLICLMNGKPFYSLPENITILAPPFSIKRMPRVIFLLCLMIWLRMQIQKIDANTLLSFGGKFNSFVLISAWGLKVTKYISDRSRPGISYGKLLDWLNIRTYRKADGIIAQTEMAKDYLWRKLNHRNIVVIGNPIRLFPQPTGQRSNIILNVGRIISSKRQGLLMNYFANLNPVGWSLYFVGGGNEAEKVRNLSLDLNINDKVVLTGEVKEVDKYYLQSSIFAFTSISEGFPNALAEAMAAGLACISYNCEAGPSDLIEDGVDGFLIPLDNHELFTSKLHSLISDQNLRERLGRNAREKAQKYDVEIIGQKYIDFLNVSGSEISN